MTIAAAEMGARDGRQLNALNLQPGEQISAATYIFACGPWFPKVFPELMGKRLRISMGHTFYFATPPRGVSRAAESFKQGPVLGEYIARRVMDIDDEPELAEGFRLSEEEFG